MGEEGEPEILEFYRIDTWRSVVSAFVLGGTLVSIGCFALAGAYMGHKGTLQSWLGLDVPEAVIWTLALIGATTTPAGPILLLRRLFSTMRDDDYLALRRDAVVLYCGLDRELATWDELEKVSWDDRLHCIRMERREGEPWLLHHRFSGIEPRALAKRLDDLRRKAGFNLIPRQNT